MTDNEAICTAIVGGFTVLGAAIRWSASIIKGVAARVVKSIDDSTAAWTKTSETVQVLVGEVAGLKQQIDLDKRIEQAVEEVSGVHEKPEPDFVLAPPGAARRTPPRGVPIGDYAIHRPKTGGR